MQTMKILTQENDTRNKSTEGLIFEWADKLHTAAVRQDFALRDHYKRLLPQGLRGSILIREAEMALAAGNANRNQ